MLLVLTDIELLQFVISENHMIRMYAKYSMKMLIYMIPITRYYIKILMRSNLHCSKHKILNGFYFWMLCLGCLFNT